MKRFHVSLQIPKRGQTLSTDVTLEQLEPLVNRFNVDAQVILSCEGLLANGALVIPDPFVDLRDVGLEVVLVEELLVADVAREALDLEVHRADVLHQERRIPEQCDKLLYRKFGQFFRKVAKKSLVAFEA